MLEESLTAPNGEGGTSLWADATMLTAISSVLLVVAAICGNGYGFHRDELQFLDDARRELARHYRLHSSRELNETAYLLGYEDANSFFRAFHHWEGTTPGQWRLLQKNSQGTITRRRSMSKHRPGVEGNYRETQPPRPFRICDFHC